VVITSNIYCPDHFVLFMILLLIGQWCPKTARETSSGVSGGLEGQL